MAVCKIPFWVYNILYTKNACTTFKGAFKNFFLNFRSLLPPSPHLLTLRFGQSPADGATWARTHKITLLDIASDDGK